MIHKSFNIIVVSAVGLSLLGCKELTTSGVQSTQPSSEEYFSFSCSVETKKEKANIREKAQMIVNKESINILYDFETVYEEAGKHYGSEVIDAQINQVFDFNRMSKEYVNVATNPSVMKVATMDKNYDQNLGLLIVTLENGKLLVREDAKNETILELENCSYQEPTE
jgi:hypothetical protein